MLTSCPTTRGTEESRILPFDYIPIGLTSEPFFLSFWFCQMLQSRLASSLPGLESATSPGSPNSSCWRKTMASRIDHGCQAAPPWVWFKVTFCCIHMQHSCCVPAEGRVSISSISFCHLRKSRLRKTQGPWRAGVQTGICIWARVSFPPHPVLGLSWAPGGPGSRGMSRILARGFPGQTRHPRWLPCAALAGNLRARQAGGKVIRARTSF